MDKTYSIKLRNRFVDDFNLPISVLDSPYFYHQLKLYNEYNGAYTKWRWLVSLIEEHYGGMENLFLEDYYFYRNKIITTLEKSFDHIMFNTADMTKYSISDGEFNSIPRTSVYSKNNDNAVFLSLDLKHANFQGLKFVHPSLVNNTKNYEEFIKFHLEEENHPLISYFVDSKYTRQVIFGKLNASRNIVVQNYMINRIWNVLKNLNVVRTRGFWEKLIDGQRIKVHSRQSDELILKFEEYEGYDTLAFIEDLVEIRKAIESELGSIEINTNLFKLKLHTFETPCGNQFDVYEKVSLDNVSPHNIKETSKPGKIKSCPITYFPQVFKFLFKPGIGDMDLVFYYEKNLAKFLSPIKKIV